MHGSGAQQQQQLHAFPNMAGQTLKHMNSNASVQTLQHSANSVVPTQH